MNGYRARIIWASEKTRRAIHPLLRRTWPSVMHVGNQVTWRGLVPQPVIDDAPEPVLVQLNIANSFHSVDELECPENNMLADTWQQLGKATYLLGNCSQSRSIICEGGQDSAGMKGRLGLDRKLVRAIPKGEWLFNINKCTQPMAVNR